MEEKNNILNEMGFELQDAPQTESAQTSKAMMPSVSSENNSAENTLKTIAIITLVLGVFMTLVLFVTICWSDDKFNPSGFGVTCGVLISTLISWAVMNVFANISLTLKKINSKLEGQGQ